jgi:hypothetical protein
MDARQLMSHRRAWLGLVAVAALAAPASVASAQRIPDGIALLYQDVRVAIEMEDMESIVPRFSSLLRVQMSLGKGWGQSLALMFQQRDRLTAELHFEEVDVVGDAAFVLATWTFAGLTMETGEKWSATEQHADIVTLSDGTWQFIGSDLVDREALATAVNGSDYHDPRTGLSASAPAEWRLIPAVLGTKAAVSAWSPDLTAWASWIAADLPGTYTAEDLARSELDGMERLGERLGMSSRDVASGEATLAGRPAFRTSRTLVTDDGTEVFTSRTYCVVGPTLYLFAESAIPPAAYATHREAFERALASTRITEPTVTELPPEAGRVEDGTYINDVYGYRIQAPEGWEIRIGESDWKFQVSINEPGGESYIVVGLVDIPLTGATAEAAIQQADDATAQLMDGFQLIEHGETTVADLPAYQSITRLDLAGTTRQRQRVYLIDGAKLYLIIADAVPADKWDGLQKAFGEAIGSVELFEAQPIDEAQ